MLSRIHIHTHLGTCVNVGCIPKILFHSASLIGETIQHDAPEFGWKLTSSPSLNWKQLVTSIQGHIKSVNFAYLLR